MIGVVIFAHHDLADALLEALRGIVGEVPAARAVAVRPGDSPAVVRQRLDEALVEVDDGDGVVICCDLLGGTPSNLAIPLLGPRVEVVTGVNLPMLFWLQAHRERPLSEVSASIGQSSRETIHVASHLLRPAIKGGAT